MGLGPSGRKANEEIEERVRLIIFGSVAQKVIRGKNLLRWRGIKPFEAKVSLGVQTKIALYNHRGMGYKPCKCRYPILPEPFLLLSCDKLVRPAILL